MKSIDFTAAMDFIEDHIISNTFLSDQQKLSLLESQEMSAYAFVGAFLHYSETQAEENNNNVAEEQDPDNGSGPFALDSQHVHELFEKLLPQDIIMIRNCEEVVDKFRERNDELTERRGD